MLTLFLYISELFCTCFGIHFPTVIWKQLVLMRSSLINTPWSPILYMLFNSLKSAMEIVNYCDFCYFYSFCVLTVILASQVIDSLPLLYIYPFSSEIFTCICFLVKLVPFLFRLKKSSLIFLVEIFSWWWTPVTFPYPENSDLSFSSEW